MRVAALPICVFCVAAVTLAQIAFAQMRPAPPWIRQGGVVNDASRLPVDIPGGSLAPGAIVSIDGLRFVPGSTTVEVATARRVLQAQILEQTTDHILALMPDLNASGSATLYVVAGNSRSVGTEIRLSPAAPGIYTANHLGWGTAAGTARPLAGKISIDTTGLGHGPARSIEVLIAGRKAANLHREKGVVGIDHLSFDLPPGVHGCTVPVTLLVNGLVSNTATFDVDDHCGREPGQNASIVLMRSDVILELVEGTQTPFTVDALRAGYDQWSVKGLQTLFALMPAAGACVSWTGQISQEDLVLPGLAEQAVGAAPDRPDPFMEGASDLRDLDAGPAITITSPAGSHAARPSLRRPRVYTTVLGGNPPLARIPPLPLFLNPGNLTVAVAGGADVGPAEIALTIPQSGQWTNRRSTSLVRRRDGLTFDWSVPPDSRVLTVVANINRRAGLVGFAVCQPPAGAPRFRVPPFVLQNLPLTGRGVSDLSLGFAGLIAIPLHPTVVQAPGKERLQVYFVSLSGRSIILQ